MKKDGAFELSVSTVVIFVIAMVLLVMGLYFVQTIFRGATGSIDLIDENVKSQINQLFNDDDRKTVVYLPDNAAEVEKGKSYNIAFAIKNTERGTGEAGQFTYTVKASEVETGCRLTLQQADSYIRIGSSGGPIPIVPGDDPTERTIVFRAADSAPLCNIIYDIEVRLDGQTYDTNFFIVEIVD